MKNVFLVLFLCAYLSMRAGVSYGADQDKARDQRLSDQELQRAQQASQQRPILPPVVQALPSMVSPTPSPQITAPHIPVQVISQSPPMPQNMTTPPVMRNIPSAPAYATFPNVPVPMDIPKVPMIGNAIGKVVKLGSEKDGGLFIDVDDELFGEIIRVKVKNLKNTPIVRQASIYYFNQIKIGDTVNAMFHTEEEDNVANFISVLTEEEIEMKNQMPAEETQAVTPEEGNNQDQNQ